MLGATKLWTDSVTGRTAYGRCVYVREGQNFAYCTIESSSGRTLVRI